jgi:hypothetical protein
MITMRVDPNDVSKLQRACANLLATVQSHGMDEMQRRCATDYFMLVAKNIRQKGAPSPDYADAYKEWKASYGWRGMGSWELKGDLLASLSAFRDLSGKGWRGSVPYGAMDTGGKSWHYGGKGSKGPQGKSRSIARYAIAGEYSRPKDHRYKGQPERPVFRPSMSEYAGAGWLVRADETLALMGNTWR